MGMIRQYLKQKVARSFGGKKIDLDVIKKELRDEVTHILYDQTRRTPIVITVVNEIGGNGGSGGGQNNRQQQGGDTKNNARPTDRGPRPPRNFPPPQVPDTEAVMPKHPTDTRGY
jgi:ribonuclease J